MSSSEIAESLNTLNLSLGDKYSDADIKEAWQMLMTNAVKNNDSELQVKLNKAKSILRENIDKLGSGGLAEVGSIPVQGETFTSGGGGDTEYTYQTEYNGEESFASGKNFKEIKDCIAEDIGVDADKIVIYIKVNKTTKAKKIGSQKIFEGYLKIHGYNEEHVIEIQNLD